MATLAAQIDRPSTSSGQAQTRGLALTYHRLMLVMLLFVGVTLVIVGRLAMLQMFTDRAGAAAAPNPLLPPRGDIVDRNNVPLAGTIDAWSIGVRPRDIIGNRRELALRLATLMPERSAAQYFALLGDRRSFVYLARPASPELVTAVNGLGEPGIVFNREPERLYPQTALAGHVIGWTAPGRGGIAGMERFLQGRLTDSAQRGEPVALSIDSRVQAVMETELATAVTSMNARGGTGIVLDVDTGEIVAMASAPTFNPNDPGRNGPEALVNRATARFYELGSTFKPITVAAAMEAGVITSMNQRWDASAPVAIGRFNIHDDHPLGRSVTIPELMVYSSNIATAHVADTMGAARMQAAFRNLGFNTFAPIEINERARPLWPREWGRATVMTSGFGHGIAITPLHLALAYAALVNGGTYRPATLLRVADGHAVPGRRIYSAETSYRIRQLLRLVVLRGTGRNADAPGFRVGGKTGTAETVAAGGGYDRRVNVSTFAGVFPMDAPRYVVLVLIDSPHASAETSGQTTAAFTAAPIVARIISRTGPLLGIIPDLGRDIQTSDLMPPVAAAARH